MVTNKFTMTQMLKNLERQKRVWQPSRALTNTKSYLLLIWLFWNYSKSRHKLVNETFINIIKYFYRLGKYEIAISRTQPNISSVVILPTTRKLIPLKYYYRSQKINGSPHSMLLWHGLKNPNFQKATTRCFYSNFLAWVFASNSWFDPSVIH